MKCSIEDYYRLKEPLIKKSLLALFPETCTEGWLRELTGRSELSWDASTLQLAFLDPINHQTANRTSYHYALGCILLLESLNVDPEEHLPLIAISEAFESCFRIFDQIPTDSKVSLSSVNGLDIHDAIKANVGVALLTLPFYPILNGVSCFSNEHKLWLFQNITRTVSRVLYCNGTTLHRKKTKTYFKSFDAYSQNAFYRNSPKLQFNADLWLVFSVHNHSSYAVELWEEFIRLFSISAQLLADLHSFQKWLDEDDNTTDKEFEGHNSFILLHLSDTLSPRKVFEKPLTSTRLKSLCNQARTEGKVAEMISKITGRTNEIIESLPITSDFKDKIKDYVQLIIENKK